MKRTNISKERTFIVAKESKNSKFEILRCPNCHAYIGKGEWPETKERNEKN